MMKQLKGLKLETERIKEDLKDKRHLEKVVMLEEKIRKLKLELREEQCEVKILKKQQIEKNKMKVETAWN